MAFLALLIGLLMVLTVAPPSSGAAGGDGATLIQEGAEEPTYEEWNVQWDRHDDNNASGSDYWCRTTKEAHSGSHSAYCGRVGSNSHYLIPVKMKDGSTGYTQPWNVNITGLPNGTSASRLTYRYDTDQDSVMRKVLVGARYYGNVTITFWFMSMTGRSDARQPDGEYVGYDFLNVIGYTGSGSGMRKTVLWTDSYEEATAGRWIRATVAVPNNCTMVGFEFVSGSIAPEGGDGDDKFASSGVKVLDGGMLEGVYLDDISVVGTDPLPSVPLESAVDGLSPIQSDHYFPIGFTSNEPTVPFDHVRLYYRLAGEDTWTEYASASHPDGKFYASPIMFLAEEDGVYEFFVKGYDQKGGTEEWTGAPEASAIIDTLSPITTFKVEGKVTATGAYAGAVSVALSAQDDGSGVDAIAYRVDEGDWVAYNGSSILIDGVGEHRIEFRSTDRAGNDEVLRNGTISITSTAGTGGILSDNVLPVIGLLVLAAGAGALAVSWWRGRR